MKVELQQYESIAYPDSVEKLNPVLQKVLALLVTVYNCPVTYRITETGVGIVLRPVKGTKNPRISLLQLKESFEKAGKEVVVVPTPCGCEDWAVTFTANVEGATFAVNLNLDDGD
jgi:hypothetical protein